MAREKCGLLAGPALYLSADSVIYVTSLSVVSYDGNSAHLSHKPHMYFLQGDDLISRVTSVLGSQVSCTELGTLRTTTSVRVFL